VVRHRGPRGNSPVPGRQRRRRPREQDLVRLDVGRRGGIRRPSDLELFAGSDLNALANHIRLGGRDGNFEFEHGTGNPYTHLNAYFIGTSTRTPILIGGDEQDVTSLIVTGRTNQKNDLQTWTLGGKAKVAVDGRGRLRLGDIALTAAVQRGKVVLTATLPNGTKQVVAIGR